MKLVLTLERDGRSHSRTIVANVFRKRKLFALPRENCRANQSIASVTAHAQPRIDSTHNAFCRRFHAVEVFLEVLVFLGGF